MMVATNQISVWVNGASGRMGRQVTQAVQDSPDLHLLGSSDKNDNLSQCLAQAKPNVCVDFTHPSVVYQNTLDIILAGVRPVIGTTGLSIEQIKELHAKSAELGGIIAPNFAIGAVLMMRFAAEAVKYLPYVEIVETHHQGKADAPSGTAIYTAELVSKNRKNVPPSLSPVLFDDKVGKAQGYKLHNIPIHSIRMAGFVAKQEVILGQAGEHLSISHQAIDRNCFMPGVLLACRKVVLLKHLYYGLESIL